MVHILWESGEYLYGNRVIKTRRLADKRSERGRYFQRHKTVMTERKFCLRPAGIRLNLHFPMSRTF